MSARLPPGPLAEVARGVLEEAAFLFCDDVPADAPPLEGRLAEATLGFEGPCAGRLTLRLPWAVAREAAANLLGTEPDDPQLESSALAAAGELLNMISGSALAAWFGAQASWALGVPSTHAVDGRLPTEGASGERVSFVVGEARIEVEVLELGGGGTG